MIHELVGIKYSGRCVHNIKNSISSFLIFEFLNNLLHDFIARVIIFSFSRHAKRFFIPFCSNLLKL